MISSVLAQLFVRILNAFGVHSHCISRASDRLLPLIKQNIRLNNTQENAVYFFFFLVKKNTKKCKLHWLKFVNRFRFHRHKSVIGLR